MQVISLAASRGWPMSNSLTQIPLFKPVDEATLRSFEGRVNWAKFEESELVIDYDDNSSDVYFIVSGQVRVLYRTITGKEVILGEMGAGQFFGELSAIDGVGRSANVTALNRSQMCIMSGPVFMELVTHTPMVCKQILTILASRIRFLNTRLAEHSFLQTKHRLYAELIRLSQPRTGHSGQRVVSPPPFHHDLAAPDRLPPRGGVTRVVGAGERRTRVEVARRVGAAQSGRAQQAHLGGPVGLAEARHSFAPAEGRMPCLRSACALAGGWGGGPSPVPLRSGGDLDAGFGDESRRIARRKAVLEADLDIALGRSRVPDRLAAWHADQARVGVDGSARRSPTRWRSLKAAASSITPNTIA